MVSPLQGWNLLQKDVEVPAVREKPAIVVILFFFSKDGLLVYCFGVEGLLREVGYTYTLL